MNQIESPGVEQLQFIQNEIDKNDNDMYDAIQFCIMDENEMNELSSVDITLNDIRNNFRSKFKTGIELIDKNPLLGTTDPKEICPTCNQNGKSCPGHYSTIELPFRVPNPNYLKEISYILNCVCVQCSSLKITDLERFEMRKISKDKKLEYMSLLLSKRALCDNCTNLYKDQPPFKNIEFKPRKIFEANYIIVLLTFFGKNEKPRLCQLNYERVYNIFSKVKRSDIEFMGLGQNSIKDLMMKKILIIPPVNRPKLQDGNKLYVDGITKSYSSIFMAIATFLQKNLTDTNMGECARYLNTMTLLDKNGNKVDISNIIDLFSDENYVMEKSSVINSVENLFTLSTPENMKESAKGVLSGLSYRQKLNGKEGLMRKVLMGKRVNQSARTVVGPSPNFDIDEIGVPKFIAQNLSVRVYVNNINLNMILDLQRSKKIKSVIRMKNGQEKKLIENSTNPINIKIGDIVERELMNGDRVLANRNPTIQKQGMMGLRVRIIDENIFRLNLALTPPFNADFDGDELNIHVPQTIQAQSELATVASAEGCYGNQQQSNLMVGLVFDAVTGSFILSQDFIYIEPDDFHQCVFNVNMPDNFVNDIKKYNYGVKFYKTKEKFKKCIDIVFNYLYIYTNNKFSEEIIKDIYKNLDDFEFRISNITYKNFEQDFNTSFNRSFDKYNILDQVIEIYFKKSDDKLYKDVINLFLQKEFLEKQLTFQINLNKNEYQYLYLFLDKIAFYCSLRENLIEDDSSKDDKNHFFDMCLKNKIDIYSGKALFSTILPIMNYEKVKKGNSRFDNFINTVKINNGILCQGWLTKEHVSGSTNSIPHVLFLYHQSQEKSDVSFFLTYAQKLINNYFMIEGFTIGVHDCMLNDDIKETIASQLNSIRKDASDLERNIVSYDQNEKEEKIIQNLQQIRLLNDTVIKSLDVRSPLLIMAELAKAKGKGANLVQIMAAIGQQFYGGKRIKNETPYYEENDPDPMARGLCLNSFIEGMTPTEFVYHMYSSREGLVEGAIKTGDCGAMHHNIAKVLEVLIVKEDRSIRNVQGRIIQFIYGEDGFDAEQLQKIRLSEYTYTTFIDVNYIANTFNNSI